MAGTSEGAIRAWDTRGRGRHQLLPTGGRRLMQTFNYSHSDAEVLPPPIGQEPKTISEQVIELRAKGLSYRAIDAKLGFTNTNGTRSFNLFKRSAVAVPVAASTRPATPIIAPILQQPIVAPVAEPKGAWIAKVKVKIAPSVDGRCRISEENVRATLKDMSERFPGCEERFSRRPPKIEITGTERCIDPVTRNPVDHAVGLCSMGQVHIKGLKRGRSFVSIAGLYPPNEDQAPDVNHGVYNLSNQGWKSILRHEMGHAFMNAGQAHVPSSVMDRQLDKAAQSSGNIGYAVSVYAATNQHELWAESFAAYTHPQYKQGSLPKAVEDLLRKKLKA